MQLNKRGPLIHFQGVPAADVPPIPSTFVAVDLETTGFDREKDAIIEIGAVRFTEGEPVAVFNTMVRQDPDGYPVTPEITKATGHTAADVAKGMGEEEAIDTLRRFTCDKFAEIPLVGHNILFDYGFIYQAARAYGYDPCEDLFDTLTIARERHPYPHKLPDMCRLYGIEAGAWHSAYYDALACGQLFLKMHEYDTKYPIGRHVADYKNVIGWKKQYGPPDWYPDWIKLIPQGNVTVVEESGLKKKGGAAK
jgi:DNA polymerase III epsilon subunit-like protein